MTAKSWDEIDQGGLTMEDPNDPGEEGRAEKRQGDRLNLKNLEWLDFSDDDTIPVVIENVATGDLAPGAVEDISPRGIRISTDALFEKDSTVKLTFTIDAYQLEMDALVKWAQEDDDRIAVGMEFVNPKYDDVSFLNSLYSTIYLH